MNLMDFVINKKDTDQEANKSSISKYNNDNNDFIISRKDSDFDFWSPFTNDIELLFE